MRKKVYNLRFPSAGECGIETSLHGYKFIKVENYNVETNKLVDQGISVATAWVDVPEKEEEAVLRWTSNDTALKDIILLLSLFTGYDVHVVDQDQYITGADTRKYRIGKNLRISVVIPRYFEKTFNDLYNLVRTKNWKKKYHDGWILLLAKHAFRWQTIEFAFTQCWTIWEHLFSIMNQVWLSDDGIRRVHSSEKIAFLLTEYSLIEKLENPRKQLKPFVDARNRFIHFGRFYEGDSYYQNALLFTNMTDCILAKILDLPPSPNEPKIMQNLNDLLN